MKEEWRDLKDIKSEVNVRARSVMAINDPSLLSAVISERAKPAAGGELASNHLAFSLSSRFHFKYTAMSDRVGKQRSPKPIYWSHLDTMDTHSERDTQSGLA